MVLMMNRGDSHAAGPTNSSRFRPPASPGGKEQGADPHGRAASARLRSSHGRRYRTQRRNLRERRPMPRSEAMEGPMRRPALAARIVRDWRNGDLAGPGAWPDPRSGDTGGRDVHDLHHHRRRRRFARAISFGGLSASRSGHERPRPNHHPRYPFAAWPFSACWSGASLAVSGVVMQGLFRQSVGRIRPCRVSSGASLGAVPVDRAR